MEAVEPSYLKTLAEHCTALWRAWDEVSAQSAKGARTGSRADNDGRQFRQEHLLAVRNIEHSPGQFAGSYLSAIGQHHRAFATLLEDGESATLGPWTLVRAELEHAGRVAWLLEPAPADVSADARVARASMEHLFSLCRARYTAGRMNRRAVIKSVKTIRDDLRASILGLWPDALIDWSGPGDEAGWVVAGEPFLTIGQTNDLFVSLASPSARGLYDYLSDRSHPSLLSLEVQTERIDADGVTSSLYVVPRDVTEWQSQLSCLTFFKSMQLVASYFGFGEAPLHRWAASVPDDWFAT